jgi:hypothetical protein
MRTRWFSHSITIIAGTITAATTGITAITSCRTWLSRGTIITATGITITAGTISTADRLRANGPDQIRPVSISRC